MQHLIAFISFWLFVLVCFLFLYLFFLRNRCSFLIHSVSIYSHSVSIYSTYMQLLGRHKPACVYYKKLPQLIGARLIFKSRPVIDQSEAGFSHVGGPSRSYDPPRHQTGTGRLTYQWERRLYHVYGPRDGRGLVCLCCTSLQSLRGIHADIYRGFSSFLSALSTERKLDWDQIVSCPAEGTGGRAPFIITQEAY